MKKHLIPVLLCLTILAESSRCKANNYGILVGSNLPGENQEVLRYAHKDVDRISEVISELGEYPAENITILSDPDRQAVQEALTNITDRIREHSERNEPSSFLFYYSGHARSQALSLGNDEIPLEEMRTTLEELPATVKIIILDACQTGAFSRIKGAEPTSDFSHNSVSTFNTTGMAVLASSTASEMSQESEILQGSFFTHHLVVGLRGAADSDQNGQVTLHEAYKYAYNQTLVSTAGTAVGKQHVTLETDLKGKGEMVLTKPAEATARLIFPADLNAELLVHRSDDRTILAEAHKAAGLEMGLAFPPDNYEVLVRQQEKVRQCSITLGEDQTVSLKVTTCRLLDQDPVVMKHAARDTPDKSPFKWRPILELTVGGLLTHKDDDYIRTLKTFHYEHTERGSRIQLHYGALVGIHINRYVSIGAFYSSLDHVRDGEFEYAPYGVIGDGNKRVYWRAHRFGLSARGSYPLLKDHLIPFVQIAAGSAIARIDYATGGYREKLTTSWGYALSGGAGLIGMVYRSVGLIIRAEYILAPAMTNLYDEKHNNGGFAFFGGAHLTI